MKKFTYRLESVLQWRGTQLQREQQKLQGLLAEDTRLQQSLENLHGERRRAQDEIHASPQIEASDLRVLSAYLLSFQAQDRTVRARIAHHDKAVQEQRSLVLKSERNMRLMEKLKQRQLDGWEAETNRELENAAQETWLAMRHNSLQTQKDSA